MTKQERQEYVMQIQNMYDEYLMKTENRNISYGELAYIQDLSKKGLDDLCKELCENEEEK